MYRPHFDVRGTFSSLRLRLWLRLSQPNSLLEAFVVAVLFVVVFRVGLGPQVFTQAADDGSLQLLDARLVGAVLRPDGDVGLV